MKKASIKTVIFIILLFSITVTLPASAGVEPSPFHEIMNRINAIENNLISIERRLEHEISKLVSQNRYDMPTGTLKKLDAMAEKICSLQDKLDGAIDDVSDDSRSIPGVACALIDVRLVAESIVNHIDKLFINYPYFIEIAPERVKENSQVIVYKAKEYIRPDNSCGGLSETEVQTLSLMSSANILIEVDEDGFICDPSEWGEEVAEALAESEGIEDLTEDHWHVVNYLRNYYLKFGVAPMIRKLCKETGFKLKKIYDLFPSGPAKGACKIAGLPKPTGCV